MGWNGPRWLSGLSRRRTFGLALSAAGVALVLVALVGDIVVAALFVVALGLFTGLAYVSAYTLLTSREREIVQLLSEGLSTKEIAARLHISVKTIGTHREHIMLKLGMHGIAQLTRYAIRAGLVEP